MSKTKIEWTDKGETWNPIAGCSKISAGCANCYAIKDAVRLAGNPNKKIADKYAGTTKGMNWSGQINFASHDVLTQPMRWTRPRKIFVNSMSDLFHENVPDEWIDKIFAVMALSPYHTFQILTKRADRMKAYFESFNQIEALGRGWNCANWLIKTFGQENGKDKVNKVIESNFRYGLSNVWLGVSVEDKKHKFRIDVLRETPAAVRWLSLEPLLEDLGDLDLTGIDWVVAGGESGTKARPMHPDWARSVRDQCIAAGVPFFYKQWGAWFPMCEKPPEGNWSIGEEKARTHIHLWEDELKNVSVKIGKKNAGRFLDGREWNEFPEEKI